MRPGDLVLWKTPVGSQVLGLLLREAQGHGGVSTGWWYVFADSGLGFKSHLTRSSRVDVLEETP